MRTNLWAFMTFLGLFAFDLRPTTYDLQPFPLHLIEDTESYDNLSLFSQNSHCLLQKASLKFLKINNKFGFLPLDVFGQTL